MREIENISNVGITAPSDEKYSSGLGYIIIPSDLPRDQYLLDCFQNFRVSLATAHNGVMHRVNISEDDLNFIVFPKNYKLLGSPIYYIIDPISNQPYVIKRFNNVKKLGTNKENEFVINRVLGNSFVEIKGNSDKGFLSVVVNNDNNAEIDIIVNNVDDKGILNLNIKGSVNVNSTVDNNLQQNNQLYSKTVDANDNDTYTEIIQKTNEIDVNSPLLKINNGKENFILGQKFKTFTTNLITEIGSSTVTTMLGLMPLMNAEQIDNYIQKIDDFLSKVGFIDK